MKMERMFEEGGREGGHVSNQCQFFSHFHFHFNHNNDSRDDTWIRARSYLRLVWYQHASADITTSPSIPHEYLYGRNQLPKLVVAWDTSGSVEKLPVTRKVHAVELETKKTEEEQR